MNLDFDHNYEAYFVFGGIIVSAAYTHQPARVSLGLSHISLHTLYLYMEISKFNHVIIYNLFHDFNLHIIR